MTGPSGSSGPSPSSRPPRWSQALLSLALPSRDRDAILGDLAEEFAVRAGRKGDRAARRWYRRQVARSLAPALRRRVTDGDGRGKDGRTAMGMAELARELKTSGRGLIRSPAFTGVAVLTLALGIGASAAMYAVVDSVVLRPLGYPDADRLVRLDHPVPGQGPDERWQLSVAGYFHFQDEMESLEELGAFYPTSVNLTGDQEPERLPAAAVTASLLRVLGARPALGRLFTEETDDPGAPREVLLSHGLWQRRFGADPDVVGRTIQVDGGAVPVAGVLEPGFDLPEREIDLWTAFQMDRTAEAVNDHNVQAIGRLGPGATAERARAEMARLTERLPELFPAAYSDGFMRSTRFSAGLRPLRETVLDGVDRALWLILAGVAIVLLVALANVANLFLVRTEGRIREVAIRSALGADRASLARYFLGEGLLLAGAAGLLGLGIAAVGVEALVGLAPPDLPRLDEVSVRGGTVVVTAGLAALSGVVFGAFPLWRTAGTAPGDALGEGGRGRTSGRRTGSARDGLVVAQVAMALVLLTASGLMVRSFQRLASVDAGFEPEGVVAFDLSLPWAAYPGADAVYRLHRELLVRLEAAPGIVSAGASDAVPIDGDGRCVAVSFENARTGEAFGQGCPEVRFVSPGYFETMGIALQEGRAFHHDDNDARTAPLVVSRAMADAVWEGQEALGRGARLWGATFYRVVGVVDDVRGAGLGEPVTPTLYYPLRAAPGESMPGLGDMTFVVRPAPGTNAVQRVREVVASLDPNLPVTSVRSMEEVVAASMVRTTFTLLLLGIAGGLALLLGLVGMYGVVAYAVSRRTSELGIRMALGAGAGRVRGMVLRHAAALVLAGVGIGLVLAWAGTGLLTSLLYEVSPTDPLTFAAAAAALVAVSLVAAWVPAHRATRIDPSEALRAE